MIAHSDLTSTLSILLGVPLPNNAIGYPVLNLLPSKMTSRNSLIQLNKNMLKHFSEMLEFYAAPLTIEETAKFNGKLSTGVDLDDQEIVLEFVSQKLNFLKYSSPD